MCEGGRTFETLDRLSVKPVQQASVDACRRRRRRRHRTAASVSVGDGTKNPPARQADRQLCFLWTIGQRFLGPSSTLTVPRYQ